MLASAKQKRETRKQFKDFAEVLDIVYFGSIKESDEYLPTKGVTFTPTSRDKHYMSGNYDGFEISALLRSTSFETSEIDTITWSILTITLTVPQHPHILVTNHRYSKSFYEHLHFKYPKLKNQNHLFNEKNLNFSELFKVYSSLEDARYLVQLFTDLAMQAFYMQFPRYEFELVGGQLIVSYRGEASLQQLKEMLAAATWFTEHTEYILTYNT